MQVTALARYMYRAIKQMIALPRFVTGLLSQAMTAVDKLQLAASYIHEAALQLLEARRLVQEASSQVGWQSSCETCCSHCL
jgi:hypothetical protein